MSSAVQGGPCHTAGLRHDQRDPEQICDAIGAVIGTACSPARKSAAVAAAAALADGVALPSACAHAP
eukprot:12805845-Alexandrium_andersonii.AAC.1